MIAKVLGSVGGSLIPPGLDSSMTWRLAVSGSIFAILLWIVWAMGMFGGGLARAGTQSEILSELKSQKIERIEEKILERQKDFCSAEQGSAPRQYYLEQRNEKLNEYQELTGNMYSGLPSCGEL